jgi:hypothetical protein
MLIGWQIAISKKSSQRKLLYNFSLSANFVVEIYFPTDPFNASLTTGKCPPDCQK